MPVVVYEHHGDPGVVSYWIRRCMPTLGSIDYSVYIQRKGGEPELLFSGEFKENDSYHPPKTVCLEDGDRLLAEAIPEHISFCVSGPSSC